MTYIVPCEEEAEWAEGNIPYIRRIQKYLEYIPREEAPCGLYRHPLGQVRILEYVGDLLLPRISKMFDQIAVENSEVKTQQYPDPRQSVLDGMFQETLTEYQGVKVILREGRSRLIVDGRDEALLSMIEHDFRQKHPDVIPEKVALLATRELPLTLAYPGLIFAYQSEKEEGVLIVDFFSKKIKTAFSKGKKNRENTHLVQTCKELFKMGGMDFCLVPAANGG